MDKMELDLSTVEPLLSFRDESRLLSNTASFSLFFIRKWRWIPVANSEIKILRKYCKFYTYLIFKLNVVLVITLSTFHFGYIK